MTISLQIRVLESLEHLRIEKTRIKPLETGASTRGGNAKVEPAVLVPAEPSNASGTDDTEYVAVKKLLFGEESDYDQALAVSFCIATSRAGGNSDWLTLQSKSFAHEVDLLSKLSYDSVVKIIGFVEDIGQGVAWMIFSWEKNGNLREFVSSAKWELPERVSLVNAALPS